MKMRGGSIDRPPRQTWRLPARASARGPSSSEAGCSAERVAAPAGPRRRAILETRARTATHRPTPPRNSRHARAHHHPPVLPMTIAYELLQSDERPGRGRTACMRRHRLPLPPLPLPLRGRGTCCGATGGSVRGGRGTNNGFSMRTTAPSISVGTARGPHTARGTDERIHANADF